MPVLCAQVQRKLAELHLIPGLSELFEQFIWKCQAYVVDLKRGSSLAVTRLFSRLFFGGFLVETFMGSRIKLYAQD